MKRVLVLVIGLALALASCNSEDSSSGVTTPTPPTGGGTTPPAPQNPNIILRNAAIYVGDTGQTRAVALAYDETGTILEVGTLADVQAAAGDGAEEKDLQGAFVMPGFQDLHVHAVEAGINANRCIVPATATLNVYRSSIQECAADQSAEAWVFAAGVSVADIFNVTDSPIALLDELVPDRPALILDSVGHGAWANTAALAEVGYLDSETDPQGGIIDRFEDGSPTGIVFENAQQRLRTAALPPTDANLDENYRGLLTGLETLAQNGITTVGDAGGYWTRGHEQAWTRAESEGTLTVRASNTLYVYPDRDVETQVQDIIARRTDNPSDMVQFDQVKIYIDGILSLGTGALYEPYSTDPGVVVGYPSGFEYFETTQLHDLATRLDSAGFQLHFHATGDRGVGLALDAIAAVRESNGAGEAHRVTHCYLIDETDRQRFVDLNVVADFQISPGTAGTEYREFIRRVIGERADELFPVRSMLDAGANVILTSDWDADELSPLQKLEIALTRDREAVPDLATAVAMMTILPAEVIGRDTATGSLEAGKLADFVVLDQDIFSLEQSRIGETRVMATVVGGRVVYDRSGLLD